MSEDYLQREPIATWNPARGVWETNQLNLLCGHSALWQAPWPTSGMTVNGQAFELQTQAHPTSVSESSLLRSPKASEGEGGALGEAEARKRGNTVGVRDQVMDLVASQGKKVSWAQVNELMPTPTVNDMGANLSLERWDEWTQEAKAKHGNGNGHGRSLSIESRKLLPTPITRDYKDGQSEVLRDGKVQTDTVGRAIMNSGEVLLGTPRANAADSSAVEVSKGAPKARLEDQVHTEWGKFETAIRRWEAIIKREAPAPTLPDGKEGAHRLSSRFTEWMMGLPEGWVTDVGLGRKDELKACGNGVVPQQAELALRMLLEGVDLHADN